MHITEQKNEKFLQELDIALADYRCPGPSGNGLDAGTSTGLSSDEDPEASPSVAVLPAYNEYYDISLADQCTQTLDSIPPLHSSCLTSSDDSTGLIELALTGPLRALSGRVQAAMEECSAFLEVAAEEGPGLHLSDVGHLSDFRQASDWTDDLEWLLQRVRECGANLSMALDSGYTFLFFDCDVVIDIEWYWRLDRWWPDISPPASLGFVSLPAEAWQSIYDRFGNSTGGEVLPAGGASRRKKKKKRRNARSPA